MTYVPTWQGFIFLAIVLDVWSRRVVGWKIGDEMTAQLVNDALNMAGTQRKPTTVIHHSDQGSQYTSLAFGNRCKVLGVRPSMALGQPLGSVAMLMTMLWRKVSSPVLNVSCSIEKFSRPARRLG